MKIETTNNVTVIKINNKVYFKIQDIAEKYNAHNRLHKVSSNLNVILQSQILAYKKQPYYKYNSADYISKEALVAFVEQRIKKLEKVAKKPTQSRPPEKFDSQTAIWVRDNLSINIDIRYITGDSNRSNFSVNGNAKACIKRSTKAMPK